MGYSCSKDAAQMLGVISHFYATNGNPNVLTIGDKRYFFERGRENSDGAITGTLMEMLPGDLCQRVGRIRIEPDGMSFRVPRVRGTDKQEIVNTFLDMRARNPQMLCQWSIGRI